MQGGLLRDEIGFGIGSELKACQARRRSPRAEGWQDGHYIALADHGLSLPPDGVPLLVVIQSGRIKAQTELSAKANQVAWAPDGKLIAKGSNLCVLLNDELIYDADDLTLSGTPNKIIAIGLYDGAEGRFDNFKFWNLDGVEF